VIEEAKVTLAEVNFDQIFTTSAITRDGVEAVFQPAAELYAKKGSNAAEGQKLSQKEEPCGCC
jgi:hypothetical protein